MKSQFKVLKIAVKEFKRINDGKDQVNLRLHKVKLCNERSVFLYKLFDFDENNENRRALEHARNCAYENLLTNDLA